MRLNLARTLTRSAVNGPGERFVIWVQGCAAACPGCWNLDTWNFKPRDVRETSTLASEVIRTPGIEGVTFSGGEPFAQASAVADVARAARAAGLSVFVFTGFDLQDLTSDAHRELLALTDVLVTGRYVESERTLDLPWRGSTNQRVHFLTNRYDAEDMAALPQAEVHIAADGTISLTGFPDAEMVQPETTALV